MALFKFFTTDDENNDLNAGEENNLNKSDQSSKKGMLRIILYSAYTYILFHFKQTLHTWIRLLKKVT